MSWNEMQKWNISTDRTQRVDEKNEVICLLNMLTPWVMTNKTSKMAHFLYLLLMTDQNITAWAKYLIASERSHLALLEKANH